MQINSIEVVGINVHGKEVKKGRKENVSKTDAKWDIFQRSNSESMTNETMEVYLQKNMLVEWSPTLLLKIN